MEERMQPIGDSASESGSRNLLTILRRRIWITIPVALLVMGAAVAYALVQPRLYEASAWMLVSGAGAGGDRGMLLTEADVWRSLQGDITMHVRLIRRGEMAEKVQEALRLEGTGYQLAGSVEADRVPGVTSNLIALTYRSEEPRKAMEVANVWARVYAEDARERSVSSTVSAMDYVQDQMASVESELREMEEQMAGLEQEYLDSGISISADAGGGRLASLMARTAENRIEMEALQAQIDRTLSRLEEEPREIEEVQEQPSHRAIAIEQQLSQHHIELQNRLQDYYEDSPEVEALRGQIQRLEDQLEERAQMTRSAVITQPNPVYLSAQDNLIDLYGQLDSQRARQAALLGQLAEQRALAETVPAGSIAYNELMRKVQGLQSVHSSLLSRSYELQLERATALSPVRIVREAEMPQTPVSPQHQSILLAGVIAALLLGAMAAVVLDHVDDTFADPNEIRDAVDLRLVGALPVVDESESEQVQIGGAGELTRTPFANAARMLASTLRIEMVSEGLTSIVVTAAGRDEGKTLVATNLAAALAGSGETVLLIDADLHHPRVDAVAGLDREPGLSNLLVGDMAPEEIIQDTEVSNLRAIAAGPLPPSPVDLLASARGRETIEQLNALADYVVWDTPPAGFLADATVIAHATDRTLFVVGKNARRSAVRQTVAHLREAGVRLIGVCANQIRRSGSSYYYEQQYYDEDE